MENQTAYLLGALESLEKEPASGQILAGFDGFIDEILTVVKTRHSAEEFEEIASIAEFSERVAAAAGKSCNLELITKCFKAGGNGPLLATALAEQQLKVIYAGALGLPDIHHVFHDLQNKCKVISFAEPGHTQALEFNDGKIMLGKMECLKEINWVNLLKIVPHENMQRLISETRLLCLVNWTMLTEMNSFLNGIYEILTAADRKPEIFIDLTDPGKRSSADLLKALELIMKLQSQTGVILGLNESESLILANVLGEKELQSTAERAEFIRHVLGLKIVVIHPLKGAAAADRETVCEISGPFTPHPVLTTGAGDNFNAGFLSGYLRGLELTECLMTGVCTSGFYVRNGRSPQLSELISFMERWAEAKCGDI